MDTAGGSPDPRARAVIACLEAASTTWVEIMDLYDECLAAVRG
ncbi:hypothetical protein [Kutzneria albida]|uniref:Uncharacterized protein n=1 Tax=Kutzneria albida DSM 43870 TaxID=1449976 RepID=W5W958_9PSEU|nr:hypothetical protein [Kutzneria albida]AHH97280.1 hypothetical protein KALB_3916 [Kutzneria albida DSM 43870]